KVAGVSGETGRGGENSGESGEVTSGSAGRSNCPSAISRYCQRCIAIVYPTKRNPTGPFKTIVDLWSHRCTGRAMTNDRTILITGVTGNQGGAVAEALQGTGFHLRGLTRTPDSQRAAALARHGIDIVKGDLD